MARLEDDLCHQVHIAAKIAARMSAIGRKRPFDLQISNALNDRY